MRTVGLGLTIFAMACGTSGAPPSGVIPCPSGDCGNETFRAALPSRASVLVDFAAARARVRVASTSQSLESLSPALVSVEEYVTDINEEIEDIFLDLEEAAQSAPELADDSMNRWRMPDGEEEGLENVVEVSVVDEGTYLVHLWVGEEGFDPEATNPVIEGEVELVDGEQQKFWLLIALDADPALDATGNIYIDMMPFDGGERELWYDLEGVSFEGEPAETSITTYFDFGDDDGGLEYLMDLETGDEATVYARWSPEGGRYDHFATGLDADELMTSCWDGDGAEVFAAEAWIDEVGVDGELDGDEADCRFGPVDGHPDPGEAFDDLPADGEWDEMLAE